MHEILYLDINKDIKKVMLINNKRKPKYQMNMNIQSQKRYQGTEKI